MVSVSFRHLFYQPMDEKIKTWTLRFPAKENPSMKKALFDWPIVLQYDVNVKYRLISRKFSGMKFLPARSLNQLQPKARRVCIRSITNQIALFPCLCCFCFVRAFTFQGHTRSRTATRRIFTLFLLKEVKFFPDRKMIKLLTFDNFNSVTTTFSPVNTRSERCLLSNQ